VLALKIPLLLGLAQAGVFWLYLSFPLAELLTAGLALLLVRARRGAADPK
jgi:hypothetical protein